MANYRHTVDGHFEFNMSDIGGNVSISGASSSVFIPASNEPLIVKVGSPSQKLWWIMYRGGLPDPQVW